VEYFVSQSYRMKTSKLVSKKAINIEKILVESNVRTPRKRIQLGNYGRQLTHY
jgi:hypothetical protein